MFVWSLYHFLLIHLKRDLPVTFPATRFASLFPTLFSPILSKSPRYLAVLYRIDLIFDIFILQEMICRILFPLNSKHEKNPSVYKGLFFLCRKYVAQLCFQYLDQLSTFFSDIFFIFFITALNNLAIGSDLKYR